VESILPSNCFRALGYDPKRVPEVLGHDGFPDAGPWRFGDSGNGWISSLHTMAEYLTMVEIFFSHASVSGGRIVVPKKAMKAVYAAGLFRTALGASTERIITIRHPVPCCISTYDAAGGFPRDGCFALRGNIEKFCARDLVDLGLGSRLITPTMPGRQRDIQKRDNCVPVCHSGLRHV
jgi:hypothetical protein